MSKIRGSVQLYRTFWILVLLFAFTPVCGAAPVIPSPSPSPLSTPSPLTPLPLPPTPAAPPHTPVVPTRFISVSDAMLQALRDNPAVLSALASYRQSRQKITEAYVPMNPTVGLTSQFFQQLAPPLGAPSSYNPLLQLVPGATLNNYSMALQVQQTLYTFGRVHWNVLASRLTAKQSAQALRTAIYTLLQQVRSDYIQVQLACTQQAIAQSRVDQRQGFLNISEDRYRGGTVPLYDVLSYQSSLTQGQQAALVADNQYDLANAALIYDLNDHPDTRFGVPALELGAPPPPSLDDGLAYASLHRPEILTYEWAARSADANVQAVARQNAPTLNLQLGYTAANDQYLSLGDQFQAGLVLNFPILDGGLAHIQKMEAIEALKITRQQLEAARRSVRLDVENAYLNLTNQWQQFTLADRGVQQATASLTIAQVRYREGLTDTTTVLQQGDSYIQARINLATTLAAYQTAWVNWDRALARPLPIPLPPELEVDWSSPLPEPAPSVNPTPRRDPPPAR